MAFVKLPSALRSIVLRRPDGGAARVDFSVFAGEVEREQRSRDSGAARWIVRSSRQRQSFEFLELPITARPGDVVAIVAALPENAATGPIIAVADLDADQRVDFLHREEELLSLLSGYKRDHRYWRMSLGGLSIALLKGLAIGALVLFSTAVFLSGATLDPTLAPVALARSALDLLATHATALGGPALAGGLAAALTVTHSLLRRWLTQRARARFQTALLDNVWNAAGEALGFVQDNADAFRAPQDQAGLERMRREHVQKRVTEPSPAAASHRPPRRGRKSDGVPVPAFLAGKSRSPNGRAALN